jgi:hypothetical protein
MLELGIFVSHIVWRLRTRKVRREAAAQGKTFDDVAAEYEAQGVQWEFAERKLQIGRTKADDEEQPPNLTEAEKRVVQ